VPIFRVSSPFEDIMLECSRTEVVIEGRRGSCTSTVEKKIKKLAAEGLRESLDRGERCKIYLMDVWGSRFCMLWPIWGSRA
jgi:hypothetical protein